jgi:hypothetical protein
MDQSVGDTSLPPIIPSSRQYHPGGSARPGFNADDTARFGQAAGLTPAHLSRSALLFDTAQAASATASVAGGNISH